MAPTVELKTYVIKLSRIGDAAGEVVENQDRTIVPPIGDVSEVSMNEATVLARSFRSVLRTWGDA